MSISVSNSAIMIEKSCIDCDVRDFSSEIVFSSFSKGRVMRFSISAAELPKYGVLIKSCGNEISGKDSLGIFVYAKSPKMKMIAVIKYTVTLLSTARLVRPKVLRPS